MTVAAVDHGTMTGKSSIERTVEIGAEGESEGQFLRRKRCDAVTEAAARRHILSLIIVAFYGSSVVMVCQRSETIHFCARVIIIARGHQRQRDSMERHHPPFFMRTHLNCNLSSPYLWSKYANVLS